jgi:hypothetical protein
VQGLDFMAQPYTYIGTSCIDWAKLGRFYLNTDTEFSLRNVVLKYKQAGVLDKNRAMKNIQKHNICGSQIICLNTKMLNTNL